MRSRNRTLNTCLLPTRWGLSRPTYLAVTRRVVSASAFAALILLYVGSSQAQFSYNAQTQSGEALPSSQSPVPLMPQPQFQPQAGDRSSRIGGRTADTATRRAGIAQSTGSSAPQNIGGQSSRLPSAGTSGAATTDGQQAPGGGQQPTGDYYAQANGVPGMQQVAPQMGTPMILVPAPTYAAPIVPPGAGPQYYSAPQYPAAAALPGSGVTVWPPHSALPQQVPGLIPLQPGGSYSVPVGPKPPNGQLEIQNEDDAVTILAQDVDLRIVLANLSAESKVNIVVAENVTGRVTTSLRNVPLWHALDAILKVNGLVWSQQGDIIFVNRPNAMAMPSAGSMPGQILQVYDLNYVSAVEVVEIVRGLLSPAGRAFTHAATIASTRQTRERLIVEDYPDRLHKIALYLQSVDTPPRQVLIEAHVLQVTLTEDTRHGVNFKALARLSGARVNFNSAGFADTGSSPGFTLGIDGSDLDTMLECLKSSSEVRTLAAPKVLCVNGQEARIQIGSKFGYFVTTTTQTSTLQNVNFLDIGVVLQIQPIIAEDNQVLLTVEPKVSGGRINPTSKLPEEDTTEATTTVLLPDGCGMIIGGLIKDASNESRSWIPWLGDRPFLGKLFSKHGFKKERVEVIIALTPHILPYATKIDQREAEQYARAAGLPADACDSNGYEGPSFYIEDAELAPVEPASEGAAAAVGMGRSSSRLRR